MSVVLIDADSLIYKAACPCETKHYIVYVDGVEVIQFEYKKDMLEFVEDMPADWGDFTFTHSITHLEPEENALASLDLYINSILEETEAEQWKLYVSIGTTFRHELYPLYKAGRGQKPAHYKVCLEHLLTEWDAEAHAGLEADDLIALDYTDSSWIIAHIDKDLDTIAGIHFNYDSYDMYGVTEQDALAYFYRQVLTGDKSDNVQGINGCGPVTAGKLINASMTEAQMFGVCLDMYNGDIHALTFNAQLLHMTRELDSSGNPVLWQPPEL